MINYRKLEDVVIIGLAIIGTLILILGLMPGILFAVDLISGTPQPITIKQIDKCK